MQSCPCNLDIHYAQVEADIVADKICSAAIVMTHTTRVHTPVCSSHSTCNCCRLVTFAARTVACHSASHAALVPWYHNILYSGHSMSHDFHKTFSGLCTHLGIQNVHIFNTRSALSMCSV